MPPSHVGVAVASHLALALAGFTLDYSFLVGMDATPRTSYKFDTIGATTVTISPVALLEGCKLTVVAVGGGGAVSGRVASRTFSASAGLFIKHSKHVNFFLNPRTKAPLTIFTLITAEN